MNNPGVYDLGSRVITGAMSGEVITDVSGVEYVGNLEGMLGANVEIRFIYGAGGTSGKVYIQTSLDQGDTWVDVICMTFTITSVTKVFNLSGLTPKTTGATPSDGALADDTSLDGVLGDRFRTKVSTIGTYSGNTEIVTRLVAR